MRRYKINTSKSLNSRIFAEGFKGRDYAKIDSYFTQGLQETDKQGDIPIVLPMIDYNYQSEPESSGSTTKINFNALALTKTQNTDTRRLSLDSHWTYPTLSKSGQLIDFNLALRSDLYHTTKAHDSDSTTHVITMAKTAVNTWIPSTTAQMDPSVYIRSSINKMNPMLKRLLPSTLLIASWGALILNAANINFVAFSRFGGMNFDGHIFSLIVIVLAAAEAAVGLAILISLYRNRTTVDMESFNLLKW